MHPGKSDARTPGVPSVGLELLNLAELRYSPPAIRIAAGLWQYREQASNLTATRSHLTERRLFAGPSCGTVGLTLDVSNAMESSWRSSRI